MWVRYRVGTSASKGEWQWFDLGAVEPGQADLVVEQLRQEKVMEWEWSDHFRGVEVGKPVDVPPRWVLIDAIEANDCAFKAAEEKARQLDEELARCPPCRTCSRYDAQAKARREGSPPRFDFGQCYRCGKPLAIPPAVAKAWEDYKRRIRNKAARRQGKRR